VRLYPAFRFTMGGHEFFVTKMNASEIAETVHFASDLFQGKTLSDAIQRSLTASRSSRDIAFYWRENEARFFNSIVIAAWQGGATFQPIESLVSGVDFLDSLLTKDKRMHDSFGILAFDGNEQYYALDGQHRVRAIQLMHNEPSAHPPPEGFKDDEFTVIIVPTAEGEDVDQFRTRYRRMFSALNRYAKPTDNATNIVMDEDDIFAIITRQLITDHPFFRWGDIDWENERVKTDSGKNLATGQTYFTQIEVLYEMTEAMLSSALRENSLLADSKRSKFKQVRPPEAWIDRWYDELALIWNVLLEIIPDLKTEPAFMRTHNPSDADDEKSDHLWFWPIGQQMAARVVRTLIDRSAVAPDADIDTPLKHEDVSEALAILGRIDWDLHALPWRHLILVTDDEQVWRMRSEGRAQALKVAEELLLWIAGVTDLGDAGVASLRDRWEFNLYQAKDDVEPMWDHIVQVKVLAAGGHL
jgi:DNA sulfur modification protein DndB